ncbi:hypothetical protein [Paenibacillus sp. NPDC058177]|uniref:hypothetical protein n=1 Tax=Paenibacillus sp. NPDC058177 TaxID=3346369 RepID=UPI0036D83FCE
MFDNIDFSPGVVTYNVTQYLDQEDIFQVTYHEGYVLDVGWYRKEFAVVVIKDSDWENPLLEKRCVKLDELHRHVRECSEYVKNLE